MSLLNRIDSPKALRALPEAELPLLCEELRAEIVTLCGRVGGHLGASLGAVELIVALHRVFKSPVDRLVFDVGHQAYAHKLLTGRRGRMETLRQTGGIAPFLDPRESEHDALAAGHACTAVSVALGILQGKRRQGQSGDVVAIVGDGALTGGLTFEGLNNVGYGPVPLKLVLNDNGMSISPNVGAVERLLRDGSARGFFEALGFVYLGPVDGHDLSALTRALGQARRCQKPVVVHALTQKGRGFGPAEADPRTRGHAMGPYEWRDGKLVRSRQGQATFSDGFAQALEARMAADPKVVAITPAMIEGSALQALQARFPSRVFDVGIAEQHAVSFAAGLAHAGLLPVVCIYSTFLQRAYDQVVHDVALPRLPVVLAVDRAGLVGADGATHQGAYDVSFLRALPHVSVLAAVCGEDLPAMLDEALARRGPTAIRFPRGTLPEGVAVPASRPGSARWLKRPEAAELTFLTLGPAGLSALEAAQADPRWAVLDARQLPLDEAATLEAAKGALVTVEEGTSRGGLGAAVLELLAGRGVRAPVKLVALPGERFIPHGEARAQRAELGLDAAGLVRSAREVLGR
ncbi:MAG: 1-deoxy-D-xylulose-5-phosphate synthase [Myxococcales bacterium]|nr:1-deoxy-D-xylulose-5-phosphate synthase [Myxococcales bacterium]